MRKFIALMALVGALGIAAVGMSAAPAGAGGFTCTFVVEPGTLPVGGGTLSVTGNAPGTSLVQIYYDPVGGAGPFLAAGNVPTDPGTGFFQADFFTNVSGEVLVAVDDYAELPCIGNAGAGAGRGNDPGGTGTGRLPRTGASHTGRYVLTGLAALSLGLVLVVGARRSTAIRGRG